MTDTRIAIPDERIAAVIGADGFLAAVEPLTGVDAVPSRHLVARLTRIIPPAPGCQMEQDGPITWRARRVCQCVLPEQHCPACDAAAKRTYSNE